ncbi:unnamed protein product, partial [Mesorhabditis spiculigera]
MTERMWTYDLSFPEHSGGWQSLLIQRSAEVVSEWLEGPYFEDEPGATLPPNGKCWFQSGNQRPKNLSALESIICFLEADSLLTLRCLEFGFWLKEKDAASAERLLTTLISEWRTGSRRIVFGKCVAESSYIPEFMRDAIDGVITEGDRKLQIKISGGCVYQFREISCRRIAVIESE